MRKFTVLAGLAGIAAALVSVSASAQDAGNDTALEGDYLTVGIGAVYTPSYWGADENVVTAFPAVQGKLKGIGISPRTNGAALDFIPDADDAKIGFSLGPVAGYTGNRHRQIKDDVVKRTGKLDEAIELGVTAGVTGYKLLNDYDQLSLSADVRWDINGAYKGMVIQPNLTYVTPLSKGVLVTLNATAHHGDGKFNRYYYSVNERQSLLSGGILPVYGAKKGWDSFNVGLLAAYDLDGNLLNGGFAVFAVGSYGKQLNDGKDTPFTRIRGDADQWIGGLGIGYTF
jgi:outer membrane scaffolding protein for murein synthesis (MipA/OmpV family)